MYEVTCFHCGNIAHITPDAERCIICGEDLKHLITPDYASHYFYQRAAQLAEAGEVTLALIEVERGLRYQPDAQLHLLAAILSKRAGNFVQMRQHVAAIPVDNTLRGEAEWLLRSQQTRQPGQQSPANAEPPALTASIWPPGSARPADEEATEPPESANEQPVRKFVGVVALLLLAAFAAWVGLGPGAQLLSDWLTGSQVAGVQSTVEPPVGTTPTVDPTATTITLTVAEPVLLPTPTPAPAPEVPPNVAQTAPVNEAVAASTPQTMLQAAGTPYDLKGYLQQSDQPQLADLPVTAALQGVTLTLQGIVPMFILRQELVEVAASAPGVTALNAVDLLVRTPLTYTVVDGDNLWLICYKLYGEDRRTELIAANRTTLLDPSALRVGQVLTVPPSN